MLEGLIIYLLGCLLLVALIILVARALAKGLNSNRNQRDYTEYRIQELEKRLRELKRGEDNV